MGALEFNGQSVALNEEGFLEDPTLWNEALALALAQSEEGLEALSEEHWAVLRFIRATYEEKGAAPMVRAICKTTGLRLQHIYDLFPSGPAKGACKLAGLPKPDGCV